MGTKNTRNNFPRNTRIVRAKNVGKKKSSLKSAKKHFLYSRVYRDQKIWTKKCTKQFFQKNTNTAKKMLGKNRLKKMRKNVFCIHTNIVTKNGDKKMHESICPETRFLRSKNVGKKSSVKSAKKRFYIHTNIVTKK